MTIDNGKIQATTVYYELDQAIRSGKYRVFVLEGGSRSSKTISIIQMWILYAQKNYGNPKRIIISRAVGTWIAGTVLNDFLNVLKFYGYFNNRAYNKTLKIYKLFDTEFWFVGLDDQQKLHGMTNDGFWINEAMEANKDDFDQLEMRSSGFSILDYNPTEEEGHFIYDNVLKRPDAFYNHSTMLDNPFIPENSRLKILSYEPTEENYAAGTVDKRKWEIYGLGKRAKIEGMVFDGFELVQEIPLWIKKRFTGIDFGYTNDVTAIGEVGIDVGNNALYIDELCYKTHMLTREIISKLKEVNNKREIVSESADPRLVDEIYNAGFNIHKVLKPKGSINAGIDKMKGMRIFITSRSFNAIKEFKNYTYKQDKNGKWLNEPIDDWNHIIDLTRYVVLMKLLGKIKKPQNLQKYF